MPDGTEGLDLSELDDVQPGQAPEGLDGAGDGDTDGATPAFDISKFPENEQEILRALPPEQQQIVGQRFKEVTAGLTRATQAAAREKAEARRVMEQAEWARQVQSNPDLMGRLMGIAGGGQGQDGSGEDPYADLPDPSDLDLTDKSKFWGGMERAMQARLMPIFEERAKKLVSETAPMRDRALDEAARDYWAGLEDRGVSITREQKEQAVRLFAESVEDWRQTDPKLLPHYLEMAVRSIQSAPSRTQPAGRTGNRTTSVPAAGGARAPTRAQKPWEREKRPMTRDEAYELAGGVSGREFEEIWKKAQRRP